MSEPLTDLELIYVADPMCSWCWGFAPVIRKLADRLDGRAGLRVLPGYLREGGTMPLHESEVAWLMQHWRTVHERTGQFFDFSRPVDTRFVFNTEPACRALSVAIRLRPQTALDYLGAVQHAFYVERRDTQDAVVLSDCAASCGMARETFLPVFESAASRDWLDEDMYFVHQLGVEGIPSVLLRTGPRVQRLPAGYHSYAVLEPHFDRWIACVAS